MGYVSCVLCGGDGAKKTLIWLETILWRLRWVCACQTSLYLYMRVDCFCTHEFALLGLTIFSDVRPLLIYGVSVILGLAKGAKAVFQSLIIPKYVTLEKLPAATGLSMVLNGLLSLIIGPIIGNTSPSNKQTYPYS